MRLKCINDHWKDNFKDPDLTHKKFYNSIDDNVLVLNHEAMVSILGDNKEEIVRPKYIFQTMPEMVHQQKISKE
jgi:hypothetical protein